MERDYDDAEIYHYKTNFNSHAHVERDIKNSSIIRWLLISTHTLTWSVTTTMQKIVEKLEISTHTLTWSVTGFGACLHSPQSHFNSHAHVERDLADPALCITSKISTHTLTWSVTRHSADSEFQEEYFNSHAHVERDLTGIATAMLTQNFNSHAHVERDDL